VLNLADLVEWPTVGGIRFAGIGELVATVVSVPASEHGTFRASSTLQAARSLPPASGRNEDSQVSTLKTFER
jgi:hypothetical protein